MYIKVDNLRLKIIDNSCLIKKLKGILIIFFQIKDNKNM